jgi:hypothetical protein
MHQIVLIPFYKHQQSQNVILCVYLGVNFINIFCQYFGAKNLKAETFGFVIFWRQNIGKKSVQKKLMKLTVGRWGKQFKIISSRLRSKIYQF